MAKQLPYSFSSCMQFAMLVIWRSYYDGICHSGCVCCPWWPVELHDSKQASTTAAKRHQAMANCKEVHTAAVYTDPTRSSLSMALAEPYRLSRETAQVICHSADCLCSLRRRHTVTTRPCLLRLQLCFLQALVQMQKLI